MAIHTYMVYWFIFCITTLSNIYLYVCMYAVYTVIWNILGEMFAKYWLELLSRIFLLGFYKTSDTLLATISLI